MNIIDRGKNWLYGVVGAVFPADEDKDGIPDSVESLRAEVEKLLAQMSDLTMGDVIGLCLSMRNVDLTGAEKHDAVVSYLQQLSKRTALWLLNIAVGTAYKVMMERLEIEPAKPTESAE